MHFLLHHYNKNPKYIILHNLLRKFRCNMYFDIWLKSLILICLQGIFHHHRFLGAVCLMNFDLTDRVITTTERNVTFLWHLPIISVLFCQCWNLPDPTQGEWRISTLDWHINISKYCLETGGSVLSIYTIKKRQLSKIEEVLVSSCRSWFSSVLQSFILSLAVLGFISLLHCYFSLDVTSTFFFIALFCFLSFLFQPSCLVKQSDIINGFSMFFSPHNLVQKKSE